MPVAWRAEERLLRELNFVALGQKATDEARTEYGNMYRAALPKNTVKALAALSRVSSGAAMAAMVAVSEATGEGATAAT